MLQLEILSNHLRINRETSLMDKLLELLADGEFHGGDELGAQLSVSRAAVWKQIQKLEQLGLEVLSVKGKGYRLAAPLELLSEESIRAQMLPRAAQLLRGLQLHSQVPSTNDLASSLASKSSGSGWVILAEQQTAGRGRRGRHWISPFGCNLYLSCIWEFFQGAAALEGLSLATGVAVVKAFEALGIRGARLKWPNDILIGNAKVSGILLEMTGDPSGRCQVVVGVGINHKLPLAAAVGIDQPWTRIEDVHPGLSRNRLAAEVISQLLIMLEEFQLNGFSAFKDQWESLDQYRGAEVLIKTGADDIAGVADGVDATGGLRLLTDRGIQIMKGGEMSLRPKL